MKENLAVGVTLKKKTERAGGSEGSGRSVGEKGEGREGGRGKGGGGEYNLIKCRYYVI